MADPFGIQRLGGQSSSAKADTSDRKQKPDDKRKELDAYLEKSTERREEMQSELIAHKEGRQKEAADAAARAQQGVVDEQKNEEARKRAMKDWAEKEKERKKDVEEMKRRKQEEIDTMERKKREEEDFRKKKQEYMRTLALSAVLKRLKERRKNEARDAKLLAVAEAEARYRETNEQITKEKHLAFLEIEAKGRRDRSEIDATEEHQFQTIEEEFRKRRSQLFAQEQTEKQNMEAELHRKKFRLSGIRDPSLLMRTKDELKREETLLRRKLESKYMRLKSELEVERNRQRDDASIAHRKQRESISERERTARYEKERQVNDDRIGAVIDLRKGKIAAKELEKSILSLTFDEAMQAREESKEEGEKQDAASSA